MKIPQGYKQTELGIIPEDWEVKTIGDYYEVTSSKRVFQSQWRRIGIPFFRAREIVVLADKGKVDNELFIDQELYDLYKRQYGVPQAGDVLVTGVGTLGRLYVVQSNNAPFYFKDGNIIWFKNKGYNSVLLSYLYQTDSVISQITDNSGGSTVGTYTIQNAINTKIITSNLPAEQNAIAEALSDVDALIAALDKKISKKRLIKRGAMQQLLTGKKRLRNLYEWKTIRLGEIANMYSGGTPDSSKPEYYGGDFPFLSISDISSSGKYIYQTEKTITEHGLKNCSAQMFPVKTVMYAMYASLGKCSIAKIPLSCSQAILGITPSKKIDTEFLYYSLSYIEDFVNKFGQTGTQANLSKQLVQRFELHIPADLQEQQAVATILSDMDKEIANLETRRDKYKLIKSGMMQKLLTGQIRLIKPQAKVIPLAPQMPATREIPVDAHIVAGHIVYKSHQSRGWGRTKLQKSLHLIGYIMQLNLGNEYIRNTAGPDDQRLMNYIDQKFKQFRQVNIIKEKLQNGRTHYSYTPTALIEDVEIAYERYPQDVREQIDALLDKLNTMDLAGAEILSTLYAVWNNRIIKGEQITDDLLISDFYAWSEHKAEFEETRVRKALDYIRIQNIIPTGWGQYIDKK